MSACSHISFRFMLNQQMRIRDRYIFSLGDVCLTRADEEKLVPPLYYFAPILANNLVALEKDT